MWHINKKQTVSKIDSKSSYAHGQIISVLLLFSGDMYNQEGDASEPEWVKTEREQFTEFRDKNKDGKMDKEETRDWILPSDYDHAEAEAKHLVYESDTDKVCLFRNIT